MEWGFFRKAVLPALIVWVSAVLAALACSASVVGAYLLVMPGSPQGDAFALAQLCVDIAVMPAALVAIGWTAYEFSKTRVSPALDLEWMHREHDTTPKVHATTVDEAGRGGANLELVNRGEAVATWYVVKFAVPVEILPHENTEVDGETIEYVSPDAFHFRAGADSNWAKEETMKGMQLTFTSNGQIASYPHVGLPLVFVTLDATPEPGGSLSKTIEYSIFTDRVRPVSRKLVLKIESPY